MAIDSQEQRGTAGHQRAGDGVGVARHPDTRLLGDRSLCRDRRRHHGAEPVLRPRRRADQRPAQERQEGPRRRAADRHQRSPRHADLPAAGHAGRRCHHASTYGTRPGRKAPSASRYPANGGVTVPPQPVEPPETITPPDPGPGPSPGTGVQASRIADFLCNYSGCDMFPSMDEGNVWGSVAGRLSPRHRHRRL